MPKVNVKDKRKQQLIDATMASIAKRGLVDTTITHVSEGANLSRGIVNFYFTSKEKMMQETLAFLVAEQNACWQEALAAAQAQTPIAKIKIIMRSLMGDKLCSARRLAVWSAFMGHAGTHAGYAKLIRSADELFVKQVKALWQGMDVDAKRAEQRARQMLAFIRGHHVMTFLDADIGKPSAFCEAWAALLDSWGADAPAKRVAEKAPVAQALPVTPAKPKKPASKAVLPGQLDFGDLFARK